MGQFLPLLSAPSMKCLQDHWLSLCDILVQGHYAIGLKYISNAIAVHIWDRVHVLVCEDRLELVVRISALALLSVTSVFPEFKELMPTLSFLLDLI